MKIVGCDLHAKQQSIAMVDTDTGELIERTLSHEGNAVREFYAALEGPVVVGIEATGSMQWFLELLDELGIECRVGHPAKIRAAETRKQKHDRRDTRLTLDMQTMAGGITRKAARSGTSAADSSGRGPGDGVGDRGVYRGSKSIHPWQESSQLHRDDPVRTHQRQAAATGKDEQGRQLAAALSVDRSGDACGTERPGAETLLPAQAHPERDGQGEGRHGTKAWHPVVDYDARPDRLRRVLPPRKVAAEGGSPCGNARFQQWSCFAVTGFTE